MKNRNIVSDMISKLSVTNKAVKWSFIGIITFIWIITVLSNFSIETQSFHWGKIVKSTGSLAFQLLMFTIFISLACKLFPKIKILKKLLPFRKYTGIFAFLIASFHGFAQMARMGIESNFPEMMIFLQNDISMIFGTLGALTMLLPFLTSTVWAVQKMGPKLWKNVQRLTHFAFLFTILHLVFLEYTYEHHLDFGSLIPLAVYIAGYGYLFWKRSL